MLVSRRVKWKCRLQLMRIDTNVDLSSENQLVGGRQHESVGRLSSE